MSPATSGRKTILVADDVEDNRDLMSRYLAREGYEVLVAKDGAERWR